MKFWLSLMTIFELDQIPEIARYAEELGFYGITYADHLVMPSKIDSKYPYTADGEVFWPPETPWPDPWITLALMGQATTKLHLATNIYLAALRDPFTAAKSVATTAAFAGDRVVCGVSVGWIKEEYDIVGVDFHKRGKRLDEMITVMRKLWTGQAVEHEGEFFNFAGLMQPAPKKPVPIWTGGNSKAALRRAARNDGWLGLPMNVEDTIAMIDTLHAMRTEAGLAPETMDLCLALTEPLTQSVVDTLQSKHAHHLTAMPWIPSPWERESFLDEGDDIRELDVKKKAMLRFAEKNIVKFGTRP